MSEYGRNSEDSMVKPVTRIKVFGVGGGGCNAVQRMVQDNVKGVEFYICNTDLQTLINYSCPNKIILGKNVSKGQGAGANPEIGQKAAQESEEEIRKAMTGADMVFISCGEGGGTGTGAAPVFARIAKELGALTVAIVTTPFTFEGPKRVTQAKIGLERLKEYTDSLIIVSNDKLLSVIGDIPMRDSFGEADKVLRQGVQTITDLIAVPAFINLDFADVKTVMEKKGTAIIGIGYASGEDRARKAAEQAVRSPLLDAQIKGAKSAIINVTGADITLQDSNIAVDYIRKAAGTDIDIIYGAALNEKLGENIIVTVIATGFELPNQQAGRSNTQIYVTKDATNRNEEYFDDHTSYVKEDQEEKPEEKKEDIPFFTRSRI